MIGCFFICRAYYKMNKGFEPEKELRKFEKEEYIYEWKRPKMNSEEWWFVF